MVNIASPNNYILTTPLDMSDCVTVSSVHLVQKLKLATSNSEQPLFFVVPGLKIPNTPDAIYNHKNVSGSSIMHMPKPDLPDCFDHPCGPPKTPMTASL